MNGGSGWGEGSAGRRPPGHGPGRTGRGGGTAALSALGRCWVVGAVVHVVAAYVFSRGLVAPLATDERLGVFTWRLGLQHVPAVLITVVTVLAAARVLPSERRASRPLHLSATLGVPVAALIHGYAVLGRAPDMEGALLPVVTLVTGAAVGLALDRLMDDGDTVSPRSAPYSWRDGGATATGYVGGILAAAGMIATLAAAGVVG